MRLHVKTFILQENMFPTPKNVKKKGNMKKLQILKQCQN